MRKLLSVCWKSATARRELSSGVHANYACRVRLKVEFTTEPFDLDEPPRHAVVARETVQAANLDAVDVGPFGNTAEGGSGEILAVVGEMLRRSLDAGATRVSLQVNVVEGDAR
jgi:uncharacterized protein YqgV (UPF0045/DUF77 family)